MGGHWHGFMSNDYYTAMDNSKQVNTNILPILSQKIASFTNFNIFKKFLNHENLKLYGSF